MSRHQITPAWQTSRGPLVRASGCAAGVPVAGARVFGETRQNLWPVFDFPTVGAITVTTGEDGAITVNGTGVDALTRRSVNIYVKPGTYYLSGVGIPDAVEIILDGMKGESFVSNLNGGIVDRTVIVPDTVDTVACRIRIKQGETVENAKFRVMLSEGSTAQPWCPPGLSSVGELRVASAGKNLLSESLEGKSPGTTLGTPYLLVDFGHDVQLDAVLTAYTDGLEIHGATNSAFYDLRKSDGTHQYVIVSEILSTNVGPVADGAHSKDVSDYVFRYVYCYFLGVGSGYGQFTGGVEIQLELGPTATAYEPPHVTTASIDLSGHQLRSLPDGTRDVLTVDGSGAVSVEENAMLVSLDGSSDEMWSYDTGGVYAYIEISGRKPVAQTEENTFANLPIYATSAEFLASDTACLYISPTYLNVRSPEGFKSVQDAREWLSDNPVTAVLMRDKPAITQLDPIAPPSIPAPDASLWAASDVPCDIEATTWTASGAEQGRQQAAMVALAQQVRQQAETVAALTTQALEA